MAQQHADEIQRDGWLGRFFGRLVRSTIGLTVLLTFILLVGSLAITYANGDTVETVEVIRDLILSIWRDTVSYVQK